MGLFLRHVGIDYSGAGTCEAALPGLRVFLSEAGAKPAEVPGPFGRDHRWSRKALAAWMEDLLREPVPTIFGIDHALSLPRDYFTRHGLSGDWDEFLGDFATHWPTDRDGVAVRHLLDDPASLARRRTGDPRWRRETDRLCRAKSPFHFGVPGSVATSTHAGLPWIHRLRQALGSKVHAWPFDGWSPRTGIPVLAEAYPAIYGPTAEGDPVGPEPTDEHRRDAFRIARWLSREDAGGTLSLHLAAEGRDRVEATARTEGWILGVGPRGIVRPKFRTEPRALQSSSATIRTRPPDRPSQWTK